MIRDQFPANGIGVLFACGRGFSGNGFGGESAGEKRLANTLKLQRSQGRHCLDTNALEQLYQNCDIPSDQWSRVTNVLEKLAILTAARP